MVKAATFNIEDRGKPGRTPEGEQWFRPKIKTRWEKRQPEGVRRTNVLNAHKGDELASARSLQSLANVTTDGETAMKANKDAKYFYRQHRIKAREQATLRRGKAPRVTPTRPKLRK